MRRFLAALLLALCLPLWQAWAAIGTPVEIGNNTGNVSPTVITTTATASVGSRIVVVIAQQSSLTITSVTDSAGNTYAQDNTGSQGSEGGRIYSAPVTTQLSSSGTISVAFTGGNAVSASAFTCTGVGVLDAAGTAATGNSGTPSASVTTVDATTLVVGFVANNSGGATTQPGAPWTGLTDVLASGANIGWAYQVASSAGSKTYAPTIGSTQWVDLVVSYKAAAGGAPQRALMGVGQ